MARHRSVPKTEQRKLARQAKITADLTLMVGEQKALKFKGYDRLLAEAERDMGIRTRLSEIASNGGEAAIVARRRLVQLRDVKYYVDKPVAAGDLYQTKPNRKVK